MPRPPYDAVLCDIDGVLRKWPSVHDLEQAHGLSAGALAAAAFAPARLLPAITGQVTDDQWRSAVVTDLAESGGSMDRAHAAVAAWSALVSAVDREVVALLAQAREAVPVVLVSNATTRLEEDLERQGLANLADIVVNTAHIGVAKPDPRGKAPSYRAYLGAFPVCPADFWAPEPPCQIEDRPLAQSR
jgi:putative hydrolase of the HAD superfamily